MKNKKFALLVLLAIIAAFFYFEKINDGDMAGATYEEVTSYDDGEIIITPPLVEFDANKNYSFDSSNLDYECDDSQDICAVDLAVKCTIDPKLSFCDKKKLPRFIFMEDESLSRPTKIDYKIINQNPIDINTVEIQTISSCDGMWFGLCNGNIIYVLSNTSGKWIVKDIYALDAY